jgi:DNA invertase Pin-like site-specific DNA recombinase
MAQKIVLSRRPFPTVRVAAYLRVSTEHQKYSLSRQAAELNAYAAAHGLKIIKRYVDEGRSGRTLQARPALIEMLQTIVQERARFSEVLVYDVSRWGRFEDLDEASHYEFLCRQAGVQVRYCNEDFVNDGTAASFIFKTLKRVAAAEFSRQLSRDVYGALRMNSELGFRNGGRTEFGLTRVLVTPGTRKRVILQPSEHKASSSQKVVHALGSADELRCVKRIFSYGLRRKSTAWIARKLNHEGISMRGKPWNPARVRSVLTNELYTGCLVWGRKFT